MSADQLLSEIEFRCGARAGNRFALSPLTNYQSHPDGSLSPAELNWLKLRAEGGFGTVFTASAGTSLECMTGKGHIGLYSDEFVGPLSRLAKALKAAGALAVAQINHDGIRASKDNLAGTIIGPSADEESGAIALTTDGVSRVIEEFVSAASRAKQAGFDGVQVHAAHGYLLAQFCSTAFNKRTDRYGGVAENRWRIIFEIVDGIRAACGDAFFLSVRLSPERWGLDFGEVLALAQRLMESQQVDLVDMSLWDFLKAPEDEEYAEKGLAEHFAALPRGDTRLSVSGNIRTPSDVERAMNCGVDMVLLGRAGILHHDFPNRYIADPAFEAKAPPVSEAYLKSQGVTDPFIRYLRYWPGFVAGSE